MSDQDVCPQTREERLAVVTRKALVITGYVVGAVALGAFLTDRAALGVALMAGLFVLLVVRAGWTVVRGRRVLAAARKEAVVPVSDVVATPDAPTPVDQVVAQLVGMNDDGLPYRIDATRDASAVHVDVRWKSEELRWRTLFVRGTVAYAWRMELTLDPATSKYRFVEHSGTARTRAGLGPDGLGASAGWTWKKGKTAFQTNMSIVEGPDGRIDVPTSDGPRTSWDGVVQIQPSDAKKPVFAVLRANGWRPRFDWFGSRMWER